MPVDPVIIRINTKNKSLVVDKNHLLVEYYENGECVYAEIAELTFEQKELINNFLED
jgi:hypothetical protein